MRPFAALCLALPLLATTTAGNPLELFQPSLRLRTHERRQLDRGEPIARVMPADSSQIAIFAAVPIEIDGDRLVAWIRRIEELKKSPRVLAIGRFSDPPRMEDLEELSLDEGDLEAIGSCRPDSCGLKLTAPEISELQQVTAQAGDDRKPRLQRGFREMVLQRVNAYLGAGLAARPASGESFVYWSKERLAGKPIISATHVSIVRNTDNRLPDALVTAKQIFATHYLDASVGVTALMRGQTGSHNYLAYLNRSDVDVLDGLFGSFVRTVMERRLKTEAVDVLRRLRTRLEEGEPSTRADRRQPDSARASSPQRRNFPAGK